MSVKLECKNGVYAFDPRALYREGGSSFVYKGLNIQTREEVVVKVLKREFASNPMYVARAHRESQIKLVHDNIVEVYDFLKKGKLIHVVTKFIPGKNVQEIIDANNKEGKKMQPARAIQIAKEALAGLEVLHSQYRAVIHRDIKPSNIIVDNHTGIAKIFDFSVSKIVGESTGDDRKLTGIAMQIGTPAYLSPEQAAADNDRINESTDTWAIGLTLYEMLTGHLPFAGSSLHPHQALLSKPLPTHPAIPKPLYEVIRKSVSVEQSDRYQSCREFIKALGNLSQKSSKSKTVPDWIKNPAIGVSVVLVLVIIVLILMITDVI